MRSLLLSSVHSSYVYRGQWLNISNFSQALQMSYAIIAELCNNGAYRKLINIRNPLEFQETGLRFTTSTLGDNG
jgi:hypothetical protein